MGAWWTYVIAAWLGAVVGWILCSIMTAAHQSDVTMGDESGRETRADVPHPSACPEHSTSKVT